MKLEWFIVNNQFSKNPWDLKALMSWKFSFFSLFKHGHFRVTWQKFFENCGESRKKPLILKSKAHPVQLQKHTLECDIETKISYPIFTIDNKQDRNCHATSNSFHSSSVQMKDFIMNATSEIVLLVLLEAANGSHFLGVMQWIYLAKYSKVRLNQYLRL